ncbi:TonB-dependent receptor domain-containing protein [Aestuariivivens sp. NBU2969]|uniref:TonB-dependent receptor domain-containing protein n=1 Tax=Aestuariivivens sp. NBU2969 TaxID=2873267 RepID=UPI001CBF3995|nr:TonB-dependent receptor [Aestuariivivens sp. NBU2969]
MIVLLAFSVVLYAQHKNPVETTYNIKKVEVSGKVIEDETKQPLEYATVSFYSHKEKKIIDGTITDINGDFQIKISDGIYDIKIEYISYKSHELKNQNIQSDINLGTISLELDIAALDAVEVIAEKTTVEIRLDKKIYNVGKDLTVSGGTVSDVLDNVPSVSVDIEGNVALRGNNNVRILINGKPSGLVGLNSTDALRQLPAEAIEKVEVITSPSARYEAQGTAGILNIILRRSKLQGFNGAITANGGHPTSGGISGNTNFRTKDLNFFNTSAYNYNTSIGHSYNYTRYNNTGNYADEIRDWENTRKGLTTNFGIEWYINDSASLTTSVVYRDSDNEQNSTNVLTQFDENRDLIGETIRLDPEFSGSKTIQYATNFTKNFEEEGHKFTLDFQYEENNNDKLSLILTDGLNTDNLSTIEDQSSILLQTDYVLPIGENSQFELGYRGDFSTKSTDYEVEILNNQGQFEIDNNLSNLFNFKLYINALYAQYGSKIDKFSYLLGLRMENTQTTIDQPTTGDFKKKNITGLFPTINLSYEFSEKESLTLGYSRRIERPRSYHLNPFPSRTSLTNIFQGNPDLDPSYSSLYDLGYLNRLDKLTLSSSIYLQREKNESNWISYETGEIVNVNGQDLPVIARSPVNFATEKRYGFEFNVSYTPNRKWRINTDFNLYNNILKGEFNGVNFDNENLTWRTRLTNKYTLPGNIDWQTNLNYRGPSQDSQNKRDAIFSADLAFSKDLFKEKASVVVNISDILNSRRYKGDINTETFSSKRDLQFRGGRILKVSFTYRFNQKKKPERSGDGFGGVDMEM